MAKIRQHVLIFIAALSAISYPAADTKWNAHYLANSGVMIAQGDTKILFDPFFRNGFDSYDLVPEEIESAILAGLTPWDGIDAVFISHHHADHFAPAIVLKFLQRWPSVKLYAPQQALSAMLPLEGFSQVQDQMYGLSLERDSTPVTLDVDGLLIEAVRIAHAGWPDQFAQVENIAFRVTLDKQATVMHLGDADTSREHFSQHALYWRTRLPDLALVPEWLLTTDEGRFILKNHINAAHTIGVHVEKSISDNPELRPPEYKGLDIFTKPGETRTGS